MNQLVDPVFVALKAALASALAVVLTRWLGVSDALSAGFVALVCISPSAHAGLRRGLQQAAGSLLGVIIGGAPQLWLPSAHGSLVALGLGLSLALYACFRMGLGAAYLVAGFSVLYMHVLPFPSVGLALRTRMVSVLAGIVTATLLNTSVSSLAGPRIAARRLALARRAVALPLQALSERLAPGAPPDAPWPSLVPAFAAVAELRQDLLAAAAERLFPGARRARDSAARGLVRAEALEEAAHLAREVVLLASTTTPPPRLGTMLRLGAAVLEGEAQAAELTRLADEAGRTDEAGPGDERAALRSAARRLSEAVVRAVAPG